MWCLLGINTGTSSVHYLSKWPAVCPVQFKSACYVEDNKFYLSFPSSKISTAIEKLNEDLKASMPGAAKNSLLINPDKTEVLYIGVLQLLRQLPAVPVFMFGKHDNTATANIRF